MANGTENVGGINVALGGNIASLEEAVRNAKRQLNTLPAEKIVKIILDEGGLQSAVSAFQKKFAGAPIQITPRLTVTGASAREMRSAIQAGLQGAGGVNLPVAFKPTSAAKAQIRRDIREGIGDIDVYFVAKWKPGAGPDNLTGEPPQGGPPASGGAGPTPGGGTPETRPPEPARQPREEIGLNAQRKAADATRRGRQETEALSKAKRDTEQKAQAEAEATARTVEREEARKAREEAQARGLFSGRGRRGTPKFVRGAASATATETPPIPEQTRAELLREVKSPEARAILGSPKAIDELVGGMGGPRTQAESLRNIVAGREEGAGERVGPKGYGSGQRFIFTGEPMGELAGAFDPEAMKALEAGIGGGNYEAFVPNFAKALSSFQSMEAGGEGAATEQDVRAALRAGREGAPTQTKGMARLTNALRAGRSKFDPQNPRHVQAYFEGAGLDAISNVLNKRKNPELANVTAGRRPGTPMGGQTKADPYVQFVQNAETGLWEAPKPHPVALGVGPYPEPETRWKPGSHDEGGEHPVTSYSGETAPGALELYDLLKTRSINPLRSWQELQKSGKPWSELIDTAKSMSELPHFAKGGRTPGGPIVVGEKGPEVLSAPAGSTVDPTEKFAGQLVEKMSGGAGGGVQRVYVVNAQEIRVGRAGASPSTKAQVQVAEVGQAARSAIAPSIEGTDLSKFSKDAQATISAARGGVGGGGGRRRGAKAATDEGPEPEGPTTRRLTPEEITANTLAQFQARAGRDVQAARLRSESQQFTTPNRSLGLTGGQILERIFGRGQETEARTQYQAAIATQKAAQAAYDTSSIKLGKLAQQQKAGTQEYTDQEAAVAGYGEAVKQAGDDVDSTRVALEAAHKPLQIIGAGFVGIATGTLLFSAGLGAIQSVLGLIGPQIEKQADQLSGFSATTQRVTADLSQQTLALHGNADAAVAAAEAQSGLGFNTAQSIGPALAQRAQIQAGNEAFSTQLDLIKASAGAAAQGGSPGITSSTGGLNILGLQTPINGTPSLFEQLGNAELAGRTHIQGGLFGTGIGNFSGINAYTQPTPVGAAVAAGATTDFNEIIARGGGTQALVQATTPVLAALQQQQVAALTGPGSSTDMQTMAAALAANNQVLTGLDATSIPNLIQSLDKLGQVYAAGASTPDPRLLLQQIASRILPAQVAGIGRQTALAQAIIPGNLALAANLTPTVPFGKTFTPTQNLLPGQNKAYQEQLGLINQIAQKYSGAVLPAQQDVNAAIQQGKQTLENFGVPPELVNQMASVGKQIQDIQVGITQEQTNLQVADYTNQIRISTRSLGDARDLWSAINGSVSDTLGGLEGQNDVLSRQSQLLGFMLQQRQINFQVASAGFQEPGLTSEERAARIDEAKTEAAYAQKQLDLQKQIAANQYQVVKISATRNITDLVAQLTLLTQGRTVTIDTAAAQAAVDILNQKEQQLQQYAQTYFQQGQKEASLMDQIITQFQQDTGQAITKYSSDIVGVFQMAGIAGAQAFTNYLSGIANWSPTNPSANGGGGGGGGKKLAATGMPLTTASSATTVTYGEAGSEAMAVIRNPRKMDMASFGGGGGGSMSVSITVTGNTVRDQNDINKIVSATADEVEKRWNRRGAQYGMRTLAG